MNQYIFFISGTHCSSCKILIEDILKDEVYINNVDVNLKEEKIEVLTDKDFNSEELLIILNNKLGSTKYVVSIIKNVDKRIDNDALWKAIPLGLFVLVIFFLIQKSGILNFGFGSTVTPLTSILIGLIASVSSCLAVVGGLVLSLSAKISQDDVSDTKTFALFHISRLLSFLFLGGLLGLLGSAIGINFTFTTILGILASIVMILLGVNLLELLPKNKVSFGSGVFNFFRNIEHKTFTPVILGFATFFLPCGFTQSMQVVAFSSGSFMSGALIMFAFALGTFPMLSLLSFGSASFAHGRHRELFFKSSGVVVIGFGLFALLSGLAGLGVISPLFNI